ncbi:amidohydrolase family protein, partial [Bacteroidota bacterium]
MKKYGSFLIYLCGVFLILSCSRTPADIVLKNAEVYTMEEDHVWATAIVINGNKITAVLDNDKQADKYIGPQTKVVDLKGKFVVPGFIDGHVHFNRAGELINDANLMAVSNEEDLIQEITRVVDILQDEEWITGGLWGAYEQWSLGAANAGSKKEPWQPNRWMIDKITQKNPCLLYNYDRSMYLANSPALELAGINNKKLDGMKLNKNGIPTGLIFRGSSALDEIRKVMKTKSHQRIINENLAALKRLRESGIVE